MGCTSSKSPPPSPIEPPSDPPFSRGGNNGHLNQLLPSTTTAPAAYNDSTSHSNATVPISTSGMADDNVPSATTTTAPTPAPADPTAPHLPQQDSAVAAVPSSDKASLVNGTTTANAQHIPSTELQWRELWEALSPLLLDPADVHSVLGDLMNQMTDHLLSTEVNLVLRRVRQVVRSLPRPNSATFAPPGKIRVFSSNSNHQGTLDADGRATAERYHLLTSHVFRRLVGGPLDIPEPESKEAAAVFPDPIEAAYTLLLHLSEPLWDRAQEIAIQTAKNAGLEMDVNKGRNFSQRPAPVLGSPSDDMPDLPPGITVHAYAFLLALAMRGTRQQRLHLLFYLLLPPKTLEKFLASHPAGGVPLWLLEVGGDIVFSLASIAHYHFYGHSYLPANLKRDTPFADPPSSHHHVRLKVSANGTQDLLGWLIKPPPNFNRALDGTENNSSSNNLKSAASPARKPPPLHTSRRGSGNASTDGMNGDSNENSSHGKTEVMERLEEVASGRHPPMLSREKEDPAMGNARRRYLMAVEPVNDKIVYWSMEEFAQFADQALDDVALDTVMHRLFATGIIPTYAMEKEIVQTRWIEWQYTAQMYFLSANANVSEEGSTMDLISRSVRMLFDQCQNSGTSTSNNGKKGYCSSPVWGGIGGFDGRGAMGFGIMYCVDKKWWDAWEAYVGWSYDGMPSLRGSLIRPGELFTEALLDRDPESGTAGALGSYELMKQDLERDVDYVLIPQGVWDVLYELYGGGPPLPRPALPPERSVSTNVDNNTFEATVQVTEEKPFDENSVDKEMAAGRVLRIPSSLKVALHPWIIHVHLCDPQQPYRRGEVGPWAIRVMACPDQPLWRLFAEAIVRLPLQNLKAYGSDGRGRARLWKKISPSSPKDPLSRYGPWTLLSKNRHGLLPMLNYTQELEENYDELQKDWEAYADKASVQSADLADGDHVMFEYAIVNKNGEFVWPREAAAKAGRVRRLADEDMKFRQMLRGVDDNGEPLVDPPKLVGMVVDAMDSTGRWYQVEILKVETVMVEIDGTCDDTDSGDGEQGESKQVKVDFTEFGGHFEWIDTESDRLATAGRFTMGRSDDGPTAQGIPNNTNASNAQDTKTKAVVAAKKNNSDAATEMGKVCTFPGYGACGLANLGNTCYFNSAVQCIGYTPLLRGYLLSAQYKATGDLNRDNPLGTGGKLLEEFADLLRIMWSARQGEKSPSRFRTQLGKARQQFAGADQQDAQEFLNYMLDVLHEDTNKIRKKPYVEALEDDWVKSNTLRRVGAEAWRRFLRRNRSIMADVAMGQVLNTVTCPICHFSSRNFDPFNLLSIPIPTVADVIFQCTVYRRATTFNCPWILNKPRKGDKRRIRFHFTFSASGEAPPSEQFVAEQYVIPMSRLADSGDLRLQIQNACGVPAESLRLGRAEDVIVHPDGDENSVVMRQMKIIPLSDKEGPCSQLAKQKPSSDDAGTPPTQIVAFESTLNDRPSEPNNEEKTESPTDSEATADEEEEEDPKSSPGVPSAQELRELEKQLEVYGDEKECRIYDTDPFVVAKAVSRSLWPRSETELKLSLRVDAIDHRGNWFPGSVVELVEGGEKTAGDESASMTKVRVHFDNFSTKWDELYTINHFKEGKVRPLYSHSSRRTKPTEFVVHHRFTDNNTKLSNLFGQSFYVQCQNEWTTARAGAHILAQATRFLQRSSDWSGPIDLDDPGAIERDAKVQRLYERTHSSISDLIDLLVDCDREYVRLALGISEHNREDQRGEPYRNPTFDATSLSAALGKKVANLLHRLPFEVRVCTIESTQGNKPGAANEEVEYPFSLMRTIGNYMNARHAVVLQWKEPPSDKKANGATTNYLNAPVMYVEPHVAVDATSAEILKTKEEAKKKAAQNRPGSGGLHLGVCLNEFCKVQQLSISDNWRCPRCKEYREGKQNLDLWCLPDLLTFHIKRFNCSARWREKISTKVNFPLTGLDMSEWCHEESPGRQQDSKESNVYDLIGVMNHYGSMTGGHYVAVCKTSACSRDGREEVSYNFNGAGASASYYVGLEDDSEVPTGWKFGRPKAEAVNQNKLAASITAKAVAESAEPLWLQFDDDLVEPVPPRYVVSETAYVLFYRRRRLTPSNIAKYSTLE